MLILSLIEYNESQNYCSKTKIGFYVKLDKPNTLLICSDNEKEFYTQ